MVYIEYIVPAGRAVDPNSNHNVVSGEESEDVLPEETANNMEEEHGEAHFDDTDDDDDDDDNNEEGHHPSRRSSHGGVDPLYDENLDNEDEAYVYKNMRGGVRETVTVLPAPSTRDEPEELPERTGQSSSLFLGQQQGTRRRQLPVYKPRSSDAVLSCPCCFNIVCMDCQRHSRYPNQFRAIYVMGISVDWHQILVYDPIHQALIHRDDDRHLLQQQQQLELGYEGQLQNLNDSIDNHVLAATHVEPEHSDFFSWREEEEEEEEEETATTTTTISRWTPPPTEQGEYFAVECANCRTRVAALDMHQEVYHFHGCLESS
jgi:hypothetical protein